VKTGRERVLGGYRVKSVEFFSGKESFVES
jgi:hypothetical protein